MDYLIRTPAQLGDALKARRLTKGVTQKETAKLVGLLPKTISALESTPERSSVESFLKLLSALELELVLREKSTKRKTSRTSEW